MSRRRLDKDELGFRDAAAFLGMPESTFAYRVREGVIPRHYKPLAVRPYYLKSELEALMAEEQRRIEEAEGRSA